MASLDRAGFHGSPTRASHSSDLKNAAILVASFVCVVGFLFLFLFGESLERVSAGDRLTQVELLEAGGP
jgi:hypothetical protein